MTVYAITDTKKGIAPTYLQTTPIIELLYSVLIGCISRELGRQA